MVTQMNDLGGGDIAQKLHRLGYQKLKPACSVKCGDIRLFDFCHQFAYSQPC
jgi:hypothetical protein